MLTYRERLDDARRCGGCRFWGKPDEGREQFRSCTAVVHDRREETRMYREPWLPDDEPEPYGDIGETQPFRDANRAVVLDGSRYFAALRTRDDFGCVLHEPKPA